MEKQYIYHKNLTALLSQTPEESILSRSIHKDEKTDITLFHFAAGQEMTEHTSGHAAIIQILSGEAAIMLGKDKIDTQTGAWLYLPPNLPHSLQAKTRFSMLLTLIK